MREDRREGGINDWVYLSAQFSQEPERLQDFRRFISQEPVYSGLQWGRVVASIVLLISASDSQKLRSLSNAYLVLSSSLLYPHHLFGTDGSDQVCFLTHASGALGRCSGSERSVSSACDFLAAQTSLSYVAGGLTKLAGQDWRNGEAMRKVMGTETYGHQGLYEFLQEHPKLSNLASKIVVTWETTFPLLLSHRTTAKLALVSGAAFHIANAKFMGLGRFVLPFIGTYPAIWRRVPGVIR